MSFPKETIIIYFKLLLRDINIERSTTGVSSAGFLTKARKG
jgi:hypothetical protein